MNHPPPPPPVPGRQGKKDRFVFGLLLAFVPAAIFLGLLTNAQHFFLTWPWYWLLAPCLASLACSFLSSHMLFERRKGLAIAAGVVLLIVNCQIVFLFGCATLVKAVATAGK
jgi:hypothetical protein